MLSKWTLSCLTTVAFVACTLALPDSRAQAPADSTTTTLKVTTRLMVLDVTAVDAAGKPVSGLTRDDFRVYEGNRLRPIRSFDPPALTQPASAAASTPAPDAPLDPAQPAAFGRSPVMLLVLDQLNTHFADSSFARRQLRSYLESQPATLTVPTTLLTLYDNHFQQLEGFTRDRNALLKALNAAPVQNAWMLEGRGNSDIGPIDRMQQSLEALEQMAQEYTRIPGRKILLWVGGGFPSPDPTSIDGEDALEVKNTLRYVTDLLLNTRTTLFAVDPTSSAASVTEITTIEQSNFAMAAGGLSSGIDPFNASADFDRLAPVTGGRIVRGRNDLSQQIAQAISLAEGAYAIGFTPEGDPSSTTFLPLRVECTRPGVTLLTRAGYYPTADLNATMSAKSALPVLENALSSALRSQGRWNGLHIDAAHAEAATSPSADQSISIRVASGDLTWIPSTTTQAAHVLIAAVVYGNGNHVLNHVTESMSASAPATLDTHAPANHADFHLALHVPAGATRIRIAVEDRETGRIGSLDITPR